MGTLSCIAFEMEFQDACVEKRKRYLGVENGINKKHDTEKENMTPHLKIFGHQKYKLTENVYP